MGEEKEANLQERKEGRGGERDHCFNSLLIPHYCIAGISKGKMLTVFTDQPCSAKIFITRTPADNIHTVMNTAICEYFTQ